MKSALAGLALLAALGLPFALSEFWIFIAIEVLAFALYAVSFNLLLGFGGMLSFGHAAFFGVGAYAVAILWKKAGLTMVLAFAAAPLVAALVAIVIGYLSVKRIGIYFAMLTFAFQMLLYTIALKAGWLTGGDDGITGLKPAGLLGDPVAYYFFALLLSAAAIYLIHRLVRSPFGYALQALKGNPARLQYVGVDVRRHRLATFVVAGAFAGLAGALFALSSGNVFPNWLNWTASATPIVMAVLGGIHSFLGPVVGAAVYVLLEVVISGKTEYWPLVMGCVILLLVLALPDGLSGLGQLLRRQFRGTGNG
ncbi:MAG: branched-chain amino acid ABC transporter permease [Alphaproteobacteria bacterium]|nr:branched-chain amino acid ABC transporter permease [Alphaproteobacteria bacterium]